jgi:hypothetical protein
LALFSFPTERGTLRRGCGSTVSQTETRRVTTAGALQCWLSFTVSFARRVGGLHSQPHLVGVRTYSSCGCGCAYLLQLRLLVACVVVLAPHDWFPVQNARLQPTWTYLWDQVTVPHARMERAYKEYTDELDRLMAYSASTNYYTYWFERNYLLSYLTSCLDTLQVTWEPYADEATLPFAVSNVCDSDSELYRVRCPLICFYAVEYHLPHRVALQFRVRQRCPPSPVSTGVDLHK